MENDWRRWKVCRNDATASLNLNKSLLDQLTDLPIPSTTHLCQSGVSLGQTQTWIYPDVTHSTHVRTCLTLPYTTTTYTTYQLLSLRFQHKISSFFHQFTARQTYTDFMLEASTFHSIPTRRWKARMWLHMWNEYVRRTYRRSHTSDETWRSSREYSTSKHWTRTFRFDSIYTQHRAHTHTFRNLIEIDQISTLTTAIWQRAKERMSKMRESFKWILVLNVKSEK